MESDSYIDSEEETEKIKEEVFKAQKAVQDAGDTDEQTLLERLNDNRDSDQEDEQTVDNSAIEGTSNYLKKVFLTNTLWIVAHIHSSCHSGSQDLKILTAAENGKLDVIKELLQENPELVRVNDQDGYTPLHRACYSNHPEIVEVTLIHLFS